MVTQLCCVTSSGPDATWDDSSCDAFEDLVHCAQWKLLDARVVSRSSQQTHSLPLVELFDCSEDGQVGDIVSHAGKCAVLFKIKIMPGNCAVKVRIDRQEDI